jgi:predicted esterase
MADFKWGEEAKDILLKYGYKVNFFTYFGGHSLPPYLLNEINKWIISYKF